MPATIETLPGTSAIPQNDVNFAQGSVSPTVSDPRDLRKCLADAEELKHEGNDHFRAKRWDEALVAYRSALAYLPRRPQLLPNNSGEEDQEDKELTKAGKGTEPGVSEEVSPPTELDVKCAKARAVLNANIGACHAKLNEHKEVVLACSEALKDDPHYIKAIQRRAVANDKIGSWSSLSSAQEDYNTLLQLLPSTSPDVAGIRRSLTALGPRIEAAQKHETTEMLDKLKGLGNSILGNFGLSTDNFQFVPNGQGGYSMNFVQEP